MARSHRVQAAPGSPWKAVAAAELARASPIDRFAGGPDFGVRSLSPRSAEPPDHSGSGGGDVRAGRATHDDLVHVRTRGDSQGALRALQLEPHGNVIQFNRLQCRM
ncbi:MAG: hypothetical protein R3B89_15265 [Polyangiaceae bacterium]